MKKLFSFIIFTILLMTCTLSAFAGDVPEGIFSEDGAVMFFGELVSYTENGEDVTVIPTKKIKGDITTGKELVYPNVSYECNTDKEPETGGTYLMFNYDENNPLYMFGISGTDTATLKLTDIHVDDTDMWGRLQKYLNEGKYEKAEEERLKNLDTASETTGSISSPQPPAPSVSETPQPSQPPVAQGVSFPGILTGSTIFLLIAGALAIIIVAVLVIKSKK